MRIPMLVSLAGLLMATSAAAQDVTWAYAKGTDFTRLKAYAWTAGHPRGDPLNHQRIVSAIEAQLAAKGFTKVDPTEHPDALVAYHANFARNFALDEFGSGLGGFPFGGTWTRRARVEEIVVGSLVVDVVDAKSSTIVWRGTASKDIDVHAKPESRDKQVNNVVEKLFRHVPGRRGTLVIRYVAAVALLAMTGEVASAQQLRTLFQRASRSVVVVRTVETTLAPGSAMGLVSARGLGSGTIISSNGSVLTAAHVVQAADRANVELQDGRLFPARVVASSPLGVALLKMESPPPDLVPAPVGNSDSLMTGDEVVLIGAPYGLGYSLDVGHVSGRLMPRQTVSSVPLEFIQTDARVSQGHLGGPMFNPRGEVVGVVGWMFTESDGSEGLGFAVSANVAKRLLSSTGSF